MLKYKFMHLPKAKEVVQSRQFKGCWMWCVVVISPQHIQTIVWREPKKQHWCTQHRYEAFVLSCVEEKKKHYCVDTVCAFSILTMHWFYLSVTASFVCMFYGQERLGQAKLGWCWTQLFIWLCTVLYHTPRKLLLSDLLLAKPSLNCFFSYFFATSMHFSSCKPW